MLIKEQYELIPLMFVSIAVLQLSVVSLVLPSYKCHNCGVFDIFSFDCC
jgi:hypothetical protein